MVSNNRPRLSDKTIERLDRIKEPGEKHNDTIERLAMKEELRLWEIKKNRGN